MIIFRCPGHLLPAGKPQRTHKGLQSRWDQGVCFTKPFESNLRARTSPWWLLCYRKKGKPGNSLVKCFLWFGSWTSRTTQCLCNACVAEEPQWVWWRWAGTRRPGEPLTLYLLHISLAHYHVFHYCFMSVSVILPQWLCGDLILSDTISSLLIKDPTSSKRIQDETIVILQLCPQCVVAKILLFDIFEVGREAPFPLWSGTRWKV